MLLLRYEFVDLQVLDLPVTLLVDFFDSIIWYYQK